MHTWVRDIYWGPYMKCSRPGRVSDRKGQEMQGEGGSTWAIKKGALKREV